MRTISKRPFKKSLGLTLEPATSATRRAGTRKIGVEIVGEPALAAGRFRRAIDLDVEDPAERRTARRTARASRAAREIAWRRTACRRPASRARAKRRSRTRGPSSGAARPLDRAAEQAHPRAEDMSMLAGAVEHAANRGISSERRRQVGVPVAGVFGAALERPQHARRTASALPAFCGSDRTRERFGISRASGLEHLRGRVGAAVVDEQELLRGARQRTRETARRPSRRASL